MCTLAITFKGDPASTSKTPPNNQEPGRQPKFGQPEAVQIDHTPHATCSVTMSASADLWHRRLGHIDPSAMETLRRNPATGQLVQFDNMGPIDPPAKYNGRTYSYVPKATDVLTRMREVYLLRDRTQNTQALHAYNMQVASEGYRIEESAIKLEFAATNTPQEIGVSERDGQTLAAVTRALLRDGDFPKHVWGELMTTAAYLTNKTPHAELGGATPYSKMYNTTPDLSRLRAIGARSKTYRIYVEGKDKDVMNFMSLLERGTSTGDEDNKVDYGNQSELLLHEKRNMQQDNISRAELRQNNAGMDSDNYFAAGGADSNNNPRTTTPSRTSQGPYARDTLQRYGMEQANPVSTPGYGAELSTEQPQDQQLEPEDKHRFQAITGSLLYLAQCTRYDLSYAVHQLTRACANPAQVHMAAAKHLLRYLRGTPGLPIVYKKGQFRLSCFTESSFGANPDNGRSTTGYMFFLGGGLISYGAKAQTLAAQNTVEAELQALGFSAREAVYISNFMTEIGFKTFRSVPINSDSTGALTVASNAMFSSRTKHIALRFFFPRELTKGHRITLHQPSATMLADIATKHRPKQRFTTIMQLIKDYKC
ncbi:unnamed protein product [Ectocarpus sp. CCAP 1310/34]|nr:unnamed protein product [Ectocarpus sp. CCAP 1310/34]